MNGKLLLAVILTASLLLLGIAAHALTPSEVLVVYNTESSVASVSQTIAHYYANARDILTCAAKNVHVVHHAATRSL